MDSTNYKIYEIDVADILGYENGWYDIKERDSTSTTELYKFLFHVLLNKIGTNKITGPLRISDYERGLKAKIKVKNDLDECWLYLYKCYQVPGKNHNFTLQLNDENLLLFQKLFVLKIRQYKSGLAYLDDFLKYQFKANFKNKLSKFGEFYDKCLDQYKDIDPDILGSINKWFIRMEKKRDEKALKLKLRRSKLMNAAEKSYEQKETATVVLEDGKTNSIVVSNSIPNQDQVLNESSGKNEPRKDLNPENKSKEAVDGKQTDKKPSSENSGQKPGKINVPKSGTEEIVHNDDKQIHGNFSEEEIVNYFSFLYKEKSEGGKPYLQESEVTEMFKDGLAIRPTPPLKRYKLNYSPKFPKNVVEFCIYKFFSAHTSNKHKRTVLRFFANYIEDFNRYLKNEDAMQLWADNVTGKPARRIKFDFTDYLPMRMR